MKSLSSIVSSNSGGAVAAKMYTSGMTVKWGEQVRSAKNYLPYTRYSKTPESLVLTMDPADAQYHFVLEDTTTIGSVVSMADTTSYLNPYILKDGQTWLKTGTFINPVTYAGERPIPKSLYTYADYWLGVNTTAAAGGVGTFNHMVGDGNGKWMAVNTNGNIFISSNNGFNWVSVAATTTASAKVATNGTGRWWVCNSSGQVSVSDNFGTNWTQQVAAGSAAPAVFKFMNGKLWYLPVTTYTMSAASGTLSFASSLPDTNSTSQAWSGNFYNLSAAVTAGIAANTTGTQRDACCNGSDIIWFFSTMSNNYMGIFILNTTTGAWTINQLGAADTVLGCSYDESTNVAWVYWAYCPNPGAAWNAYESMVNFGAGTATLTNPFRAAQSTSARPPQAGAGSGYFHKGSSMFLLSQDSTPTSIVFYRQMGVWSGTPSFRAPAVNGGLGGYNFYGLAEANGTIIAYGTHISVSIPVFGIATNRSVSAGYSDFIRMQ